MNNAVKRKAGFISVFTVTFLLCMMVTVTYVRNKGQLEYTQMEQMAMTRTGKVSNVITKLLYKTQVLSALVIQNDGDVRDFERVAATIMDDPSIRNVILAPDGVVSHVYPMDENEQVIGLDYFSQGAGNQEAIQARDSGQLVLGGPFDLVQGGQALVGRLPVYVGEKEGRRFWGLVSVTLKYPDALGEAELEQLHTQGFAYEIWRISPDTGEKQVIACSSYEYNHKARYVEYPMKILNADWYFRLSPIRSWYQYPETWLFSFVSLLIGLLAASLVTYNYDLRIMRSELEELTYHDPLTGVLNRRGAFKRLADMAGDASSPFVLCYLDLNRFKSINDTYGHGAGDKLLKHFAAVFMRHAGRGHVFARIGGDEFLLIFIGMSDKQEAGPFFDQVNVDFREKVSFGGGMGAEVSYSVGMAAYPGDGKDIDELMALADSAMYQVKMEGKSEE